MPGTHFLAIRRALNDASARFFGPDPTAARAARAAELEQAIARAVARLERDLGSDWNEWRWGRLHTPTFVHPFAQGDQLSFRVLGWFLNLGPFADYGGARVHTAGRVPTTKPIASRPTVIAVWSRALK